MRTELYEFLSFTAGPYLVPLIDDLIHWLKDVHFFTKLDVRWGYNNVCICKGDEWKATFLTNRGLFPALFWTV
jgi:hypothetical protein